MTGLDVLALVRAAGEGDAARLDSLLAAGADPNAALESGETALTRAASKGQVAAVRRLLAAGADPNAEREDGFTPLGVAVFFGHAEVVRALLDGGAEPSAKGRLGAGAAERWARAGGHGEIAEMLRGRTASAAPEYFPAEGQFSTVVPLRQFAEAAADDETTVVRPRARVGRPRVPRHPWTLTLLLLGLSALAGLGAGAYLLRAGWSAKTREPAPPAEALSHQPEPPPPAAVAAEEVEAPPSSEPVAKTETPRAVKIEKAARPEPEEEPEPAPPEKPRAARAEPSPRRATPLSRTEPAASPRPAPAVERPAAARRPAPRAVRRSTPASVPAPAPAPKSKVIPWP